MTKLGGKTTIAERFDCSRVCAQQRQGHDAEWLDERRSERACTRIDLPIVDDSRFNPQTIHSGGYMGRAPVPASMRPAGLKQWSPQFPTEDPKDGCPGGHYRSRFVASVIPYLRRRDDHGNRVANLLLERSDDDLLLQLVAYAEDEDERWQAYRAETMST